MFKAKRQAASGHRRFTGRRAAIAVALLALVAPAMTTAGAAAPSASTEHRGRTHQKIDIQTACFNATGPDGKTYPIYGRRYTVGHPRANTPAIVLVHGVASSASTWDLTPQLSVARSLASHGYVVIAYDRLGYRYSPYTGAGGGNALTAAAQQNVLHDLITQLHTGTYTVQNSDGQCSTHSRAHTTRYPSRKVAIIGHSAGGFIVSSYPGRFHDVVAMVQANAPSGLQSLDPPGNAAIISATAPPAHGAQDDLYGPIGNPRHDSIPAPAPSGYSYAFTPTRASCEEFNLWRSGAVPAVATVLCNPRNAIPTPDGEGQSLAAQAGLNNILIPQTGRIPVLLADADHDGVMPGQANALEFSAWKEQCGCDVSQFILTNTAHAFMAHRSLSQWTRNVVTFLHAHHIDGDRTSW